MLVSANRATPALADTDVCELTNVAVRVASAVPPAVTASTLAVTVAPVFTLLPSMS